ncbi:MAG TPA: hypothetical protein VGD04_03620 [Methylophilus sp.]
MFASSIWALELDDGKLQLHGFVTQGMVATSDNHFYGNSDSGVSFNFREVGINASYRPRPDLQFAAQVIALDNGNVNEHGLLLDYALLDYTLASSESTQFGIRLGRVKHPYGLYTMTRDVAFTRPSIILPQSIYFDKARSIALSKDGIALYATHEGVVGALQIDMLLGKPNVDRGSEATFINSDRPGKMVYDQLSSLLRLMYISPDDRLRLAWTAANIDLQYQARSQEVDPNLKVYLDPRILSVQYSHEQWEFTAEYLQMKSSVTNLAPGITNVIEGYYLQGSYQMTPTLQAVLRYDASFNNKDDHNGKKLAARTGLPPHVFYAKDWMLGMRYDVTPSLMLRAEWHHVDGTGWLSSLDNPNPLALQRKWDMLMLLGSWRF